MPAIFSPLLPKVKKSPTPSRVSRHRVIIMAGPTAVGKTDLSLALAASLPQVEIISADSMQVYRGMDIGTAKASWAMRMTVPHHLIDVRDITDAYNVVDFFYECQAAILDILKRGKIPLISGGAGFYLRSLLQGPPSGPPSVPFVRKKLEDECEQIGLEEMLKKLAKLDPAYAASISKGDRQKVIRGLEIIALTKQPVSSFEKPVVPAYDYRCWFLCRERKSLYERIEKRCDAMLHEGLIEETTRLIREGLLVNKSAAQSIGYRQTLAYLETKQTKRDLDLLQDEFKKCSRHLAKRQFTWFRQEPLFRWLDLDLYDTETALSLILRDFLHLL